MHTSWFIKAEGTWSGKIEVELFRGVMVLVQCIVVCDEQDGYFCLLLCVVFSRFKGLEFEILVESMHSISYMADIWNYQRH